VGQAESGCWHRGFDDQVTVLSAVVDTVRQTGEGAVQVEFDVRVAIGVTAAAVDGGCRARSTIR
jgi:hypothetical protein